MATLAGLSSGRVVSYVPSKVQRPDPHRATSMQWYVPSKVQPSDPLRATSMQWHARNATMHTAFYRVHTILLPLLTAVHSC